MGLRRVFLSLVLLCLVPAFYLNAQKTTLSRAGRIANDTIANIQKVRILHKGKALESAVSTPEISMDEEKAVDYLQHIYSAPSMWRKHSEPLRDAMGVLLYHSVRQSFDSTALFLSEYAYDSIRVPWKKYFLIDSIKITIPFIEPDTSLTDTLPGLSHPGEMLITVKKFSRKVKLSPDLLPVTRNDTIEINDSVYVLMHDFIPAALPRVGHDTTILVICDTLPYVSLSDKRFPFRRLKYPFMTDSIEVAVRTLLTALEERDSTQISFTGNGNGFTDVWLNSNSDNLRRFWLHDENGDSVTVWIGSPSRNTISLQAEDGVYFKRQEWHNGFAKTKINTPSARNETLRSVTLNKLDPNIWKFRGDISLLLTQSKFENWVSGGNTNIATTVDLKGYLDYSNKVTGISWSTTGRLAIGLIWNESVDDIRKNLDIIDLASKINHKAFGKFDFSGQLQFKTQSFPGYKYLADTSYVISRFFNPATMILGYGLDYKPTKTLSVNISPISYKGIYVPDGDIDETLYGVEKGKTSKNEMGIYITINNTERLFKKATLTNKVQLFSNFLDHPQNIDIDWEMTLTAPLSWFADIKINTFIIYDDNTHFAAIDKGKPRLDSNGNPVTVPLIQFKEMFGVTLLFRF